MPTVSGTVTDSSGSVAPWSASWTVDSADPAVLPYWGAPAWRDEFDGAAVDTSKWNVLNGTGNATKYDWSVPYAAQATTTGGVLRLRAERMSPSIVTSDGKTRSWKSAHLTTVNKFVQRYGRWEIRCRLPGTHGDSAGLWPSFWLRDNSGPGEVDIFEAWGTPSIKPADDKYLIENATMTIHQDTMVAGGVLTKFQWLPTQTTATPLRLSADFHTFVCEWTPEGFKFYLDGALKGTRTVAAYPWLQSSFPGAANIRLHYAVGQNYYGEPTAATKSPADYLIDYVRVYAYPG